MSMDVASLIGAVTRRVEQREWMGKPARVVVAERDYGSGVDDVWSAITDPARIPRWFMPISGELRLGGRYQLEGNAGGTINECEPPHRLAVSWEFAGGIGWVIVTLSAVSESSTRLQLEHIAHEEAAFLGFWDQFGPGAVGVGWDLSLYGLAEYLRTGESPKPADEAAWLTSGEGRAFAEASSQAWGKAAEAFGTDPEAAQAAAERTTHFYTVGGAGQGKADGDGEGAQP